MIYPSKEKGPVSDGDESERHDDGNLPDGMRETEGRRNVGKANRDVMMHDGKDGTHSAMTKGIAEASANDRMNQFDTVKQQTEESGKPIERGSMGDQIR